MNPNNKERFFDKETPVLVKVNGGELRLYKDCGRLSISKNPWVNAEGKEQIGKTVTISLKANKGNSELVELLQACISLLQEGGADIGKH